ncbi:Uncharacterised protein [Mycobacteroides abscessus subsp. abscessus]|uniref:hypothetical protein n=1 Tax=Mycobacteroides abscessus TaxID=36809 RepID=UPI00092AD4F0|nr:hypothetical protein [Mycobacteroides abscessus]SIB35319.1 Uncharacterised protein [Mycobacteroides abscessus subsp. abscessus]SIG01477.1 Uncharacterised protein [Mycobacteroides abscessus subsp. abscessus]
MHQDFSSFIGAWALLLSCLALVIEPLAHGSRWFNRALRLSAGMAGLITFLAAHAMWTHLGDLTETIPPSALAEHSEMWDSAVFQGLTHTFLATWGLVFIPTLPVLAPRLLYRRITGFLAALPFTVIFGSMVVWMLVDFEGFERLPNAVSLPISVVTLGSIIFGLRWVLQQKLDQLWAGIAPICQGIGQTRAAIWLKSVLLRESDASTVKPSLSEFSASTGSVNQVPNA